MTVQIYSFKESITINLPPMLMVHECGGYFFAQQELPPQQIFPLRGVRFPWFLTP